jgi:hypothetical protein
MEAEEMPHMDTSSSIDVTMVNVMISLFQQSPIDIPRVTLEA